LSLLQGYQFLLILVGLCYLAAVLTARETRRATYVAAA
jgi:hypothetical protein